MGSWKDGGLRGHEQGQDHMWYLNFNGHPVIQMRLERRHWQPSYLEAQARWVGKHSGSVRGFNQKPYQAQFIGKNLDSNRMQKLVISSRSEILSGSLMSRTSRSMYLLVPGLRPSFPIKLGTSISATKNRQTYLRHHLE